MTPVRIHHDDDLLELGNHLDPELLKCAVKNGMDILWSRSGMWGTIPHEVLENTYDLHANRERRIGFQERNEWPITISWDQVEEITTLPIEGA